MQLSRARRMRPERNVVESRGLVSFNARMSRSKPEFINDPGTGMQELELPLEADEDGLRRLRIDIRRALPNRRLDKYLAGRLGELSRNALQQYIREGAVTVNGQIVKPSYTIRTGDVIEMLVPEREKKVIAPEPIPVDVLYEDDDVVAVNKQSGLIVHPARGNPTNTLLNAMAYYFQQNAGAIGDLPASGGWFRPGVVHRLDRDTTGVILLAKTELALWRMGRQFELRKVRKTYQAIVHGLLELDEDVIDAPIGEHPKLRERYAVHRDTGRPFPGVAKQAVTRYRVLARLTECGAITSGFTLVELCPKTGRTHQLRVHMSYIGHPIVGDKVYGGGPIYRSQIEGHPDVARGPVITRQALHARSIEIQHPRTLELLCVQAPLPADFLATLRVLGGPDSLPDIPPAGESPDTL